MVSLPDIIGILGAVLILGAYWLLIIKVIAPDNFLYSFANFLGGIFILYSLFYAWNIAAAFIEMAWIGISFYGLIKWSRKE